MPPAHKGQNNHSSKGAPSRHELFHVACACRATFQAVELWGMQRHSSHSQVSRLGPAGLKTMAHLGKDSWMVQLEFVKAFLAVPTPSGGSPSGSGGGSSAGAIALLPNASRFSVPPDSSCTQNIIGSTLEWHAAGAFSAMAQSRFGSARAICLKAKLSELSEAVQICACEEFGFSSVAFSQSLRRSLNFSKGWAILGQATQPTSTQAQAFLCHHSAFRLVLKSMAAFKIQELPELGIANSCTPTCHATTAR